MRAVAAQQHDRLKVARQALKLPAGEEGDQQSLLRAVVVGDRKAALVVGFDDVVPVFDLRRDGVYSDAEESPRTKQTDRCADVPVGVRLASVLEDLDGNDRPELGSGRQGAEVAVDQPTRPVWPEPCELGDRGGGDVEADEVQSGPRPGGCSCGRCRSRRRGRGCCATRCR
jgi:hypothetical protein